MLDWIVVGVVIAIATLLLLRTLIRSLKDAKPTCACGQVDCPLIGHCDHTPDPTSVRPEGCPLESKVGPRDESARTVH